MSPDMNSSLGTLTLLAVLAWAALVAVVAWSAWKDSRRG
jgi:hypothetical protein